MMFEIGKSDDVAEHGPIRVDATGVVFEINSTQIFRAKFFAQRTAGRFGHFTLDHHVSALAAQLFRKLPGRKAQFPADKFYDRLPIVDMGGISYYRLNRNVVRENFIVRV
jgi:hypothetical protein